MSEKDAFEGRESGRDPVDDEMAWLLGQAVRVMHIAGDRGDAEYAHVVRLLRADAHAAAAVADVWIRAASEDPMLRWSLLYVLAEIEDPACVDLLGRQAMRQLPEHFPEGGCEQVSDSEELVAVMAIEGLGRLAQAGHEDALDALVKVVTGQDRKALRRPAAVAALSARPDLRARIEQQLPEDERYVLDLREATEADLHVQLTDEDLCRKPNRRRARPKLALTEPGSDAPVGPCGGRR